MTSMGKVLWRRLDFVLLCWASVRMHLFEIVKGHDRSRAISKIMKGLPLLSRFGLCYVSGKHGK